MALLGRNNPVGIAFGALIFAFLTEQANLLNILAGVSPDIVAVTQGVIVMAVVIAYEIVRRYRVRLEQAEVADELADQAETARAAEGGRRHERRQPTRPPPPVETPRGATAPGATGSASTSLAGFVLLSLVRVITGAEQLTSSGTLARHADRDHADRPAPASAACGPSVPAWSTSASRA